MNGNSLHVVIYGAPLLRSTVSLILLNGGHDMDTRFAISEYNDAVAVNKELDELIKKPIYTIKPEALK